MPGKQATTGDFSRNSKSVLLWLPLGYFAPTLLKDLEVEVSLATARQFAT